VYVDRTGLWKEDVHKDMTLEWAKAWGFSNDVAAKIAEYDKGTDDNTTKGITGPLPSPFGNQSYHFNTNDEGDSRIDLADEHLQRAIDYIYCADLWLDLKPAGYVSSDIFIDLALKELGLGLHALQDIEAHGNIGADWLAKQTFSSHVGIIGVDDVDYIWKDESRTSVIRARSWWLPILSNHQTRLIDTKSATINYFDRFLCGIREMGVKDSLMRNEILIVP